MKVKFTFKDGSVQIFEYRKVYSCYSRKAEDFVPPPPEAREVKISMEDPGIERIELLKDEAADCSDCKHHIRWIDDENRIHDICMLEDEFPVKKGGGCPYHMMEDEIYKVIHASEEAKDDA